MVGGETLAASYVVGADGMHSAVRHQAGIGFAGDSYGESFVLADVRMDWEFDDTEVMLYLSPAGMVVAAPLPGGRHPIGAPVAEAAERPQPDQIPAPPAARRPPHRPARGI